MNTEVRKEVARAPFRFDEHPWVALLVSILVFVIALLAAAVLAALAGIPADAPYRIFLQPILPYLIVYYLIVPFTFRLPYGERSLRRYLDAIRLSRLRPFVPLLVLGISSALIMLLASSLTSILYRLGQGLPITRYFLRGLIDLGKSLPPHSLGYILTLPCIFEEPMWRGVYLRLFGKHYSRRTTILITALGFGSLHLLNLLGGGDTTFVLTQVLWGSALGVFYGYLVFRVDSLLPAMVFHYLVNLFIGSFNGYLQSSAAPMIIMLYSLLGVCVAVPLLVLWVRFYASRWLRRDAA
jgi:membrane protease YdiL (CAAX protease family)